MLLAWVGLWPGAGADATLAGASARASALIYKRFPGLPEKHRLREMVSEAVLGIRERSPREVPSRSQVVNDLSK